MQWVTSDTWPHQRIGMVSFRCLCTARVRAAAPKGARLTNRDECTCDRAAVAYTRSAA